MDLEKNSFLHQCNVRITLSSKQRFFSFDDLTCIKELSDRLTFLKPNLFHKKPKVNRH